MPASKPETTTRPAFHLTPVNVDKIRGFNHRAALNVLASVAGKPVDDVENDVRLFVIEACRLAD